MSEADEKQMTDTGAEEAPKPKRGRPRKKAADAPATEGAAAASETPAKKPARRRATKAAAEGGAEAVAEPTATEEAPKPRRSR